jgi:hypothetical protein
VPRVAPNLGMHRTIREGEHTEKQSKPEQLSMRVRGKHFNTAGPNLSNMHYGLDPLVRIDSDAIVDLIDQQRYFVLRAPRQTGKTTCLLATSHDGI